MIEMAGTLRKITSNHMFTAGSLLFIAAVFLFSFWKDYTNAFILTIISLCLLMAAAIESIGERREIGRKKGERSLWVAAKVLLNGVMIALLVFLLAFLTNLAIMSGVRALGLMMVAYLVTVAWIIERQLKHTG
jgi:Na+/H+-dicarboxylate symporter